MPFSDTIVVEIDYTLGRPTLYVYINCILYIITMCYLHYETLFLFWTNYPKTFIILSFTELYSLCSSIIFLDKNIIELDIEQFLENI